MVRPVSLVTGFTFKLISAGADRESNIRFRRRPNLKAALARSVATSKQCRMVVGSRKDAPLQRRVQAELPMPNGTVAPEYAWPWASVPTRGILAVSASGKAQEEITVRQLQVLHLCIKHL